MTTAAPKPAAVPKYCVHKVRNVVRSTVMLSGPAPGRSQQPRTAADSQYYCY